MTDAGEIEVFVELHAWMLRRLRDRKGSAIDSKGASPRLTQWIRHLVENGRARLYLALEDDRPISGCLFGVFGSNAYWCLTGTSERALDVRATPLILLRALDELTEAGYTAVNLGGVPVSAQEPASPDHGLYSFKLGLGADPVSCTGGIWTSKPLRMRAVRAARQVLRAVAR